MILVDKLKVFSKKLGENVTVMTNKNRLAVMAGTTGNWQDWSNGGWINTLGWTDRWNESWSNGGCYITTACVEHKGLSDDCDELTTMRLFRDDVIETDPAFRQKVIEYYEYAPRIVEAIEHRDDKDDILDDLYKKMISPCVSLYKQGKTMDAKELYLAYYENMKKEYL